MIHYYRTYGIQKWQKNSKTSATFKLNLIVMYIALTFRRKVFSASNLELTCFKASICFSSSVSNAWTCIHPWLQIVEKQISTELDTFMIFLMGSYFTSFKKPKWYMRPNERFYLKMMSRLENRPKQISLSIGNKRI
mgnify:CR=1 FL=1